MKQWKTNPGAKVLAAALLYLCVTAALLSAAAFAAVSGMGGYRAPWEAVRQTYIKQEGMNELHHIHYALEWGGEVPETVLPEDGMSFALTDRRGKLIYSSAGEKDEDILWQSPEETVTVDGEKLTLTVSVLKNADGVELWPQLRLLRTAYDCRYACIPVCAGSILLGIAAFAFLLCAAGHRRGEESIRLTAWDAIPFDVLTGATAIGGWGLMSATANADPASVEVGILLIALTLYLGGTLLLLWCLSLARHIKKKDLWQSCLSVRMVQWILGGLRKLFSALPIVPKTAAVLGGMLFIELLLLRAMAPRNTGGALIFFLVQLVPAAGILYANVQLKRLLTAARTIADGELTYRMDTARLRGPFREAGEELNRISEGLNAAVEQRLRSERMKTELITNVSHDLKTPLTSIVNYADLLSRVETEDPKIREYTEVLQRQSARLKKLTEDLVEASKASTGNLEVHAERCDLAVLTEQLCGEYGDRFMSAGLNIVSSNKAGELHIFADGRHLWRILDNLFGNICKYAMPGSRVYLDLEKRERMAVLTLRNISAEPLRVSGEELTERFVRGDRARHTDGSGLGLAIARSLTELQGGTMTVTVDGDLFKAELTFALAEE